MKCYCCQESNFHKTDYHTQSKILICKVCGSVMHEKEPEDEQKILDYYRHDYRAQKFPVYGNIVTTENKKNYISIFLREFLDGKKNLIFGDVGAATGYLCNFMRQIGHNVTGSEYTVYFRRFSEHYYGIPLSEQLETKHQYDLISIYHVLEHMTEPDKKLAYYTSLLKDDGHIFIGTPRWFEVLEDSSGLPINSFDDLFHKDHLNCFSSQSLHNLFNLCGLEIVKEDYYQYGQTYLLRKGQKKSIVKENWEQRLHELYKMKRAIELFRLERKSKDAIKEWYAYPDPHLNLLSDDFAKDRYKQEDYYATLLEKHPKNKVIDVSYAGWLYAGQQYEKASDIFLKILAATPTADIMIYTGFCYEFLGKHKEAMRYFDWASKCNPSKWAECFEYMSKSACQMPAWDEVARDALKEELFQTYAKKWLTKT